MAEMIFCIRDPYVTLAYSANRFKDFTRTAYFEASLNIVLSVIFVAKYGLIGVAAGTLISMGYRTIMQIGYLHKHILHKSILGLFKNLIGFSAGTLVVIVCSGNLINIGTLSFTGWFQFAFKNAVFAFIVFSILAYLLYRLDEKSY